MTKNTLTNCKSKETFSDYVSTTWPRKKFEKYGNIARDSKITLILMKKHHFEDIFGVFSMNLPYMIDPEFI